MIATVLAFGWKILNFSIKVPVWAILGVWVFFQIEQSQAVKRALKELVAGAELAAAEAKTEALQSILDFEEERRKIAEGALAEFQEELQQQNIRNQGLEDLIQELENAPPSDDCTVDDVILEQLRNN